MLKSKTVLLCAPWVVLHFSVGLNLAVAILTRRLQSFSSKELIITLVLLFPVSLLYVIHSGANGSGRIPKCSKNSKNLWMKSIRQVQNSLFSLLQVWAVHGLLLSSLHLFIKTNLLVHL